MCEPHSVGASPRGEVARSDGVVAIHQPHSVGAISFATRTPLSRPCRQFPLWEPFSLPEEWWQHPKSNLHKINLNLFQKTIDKPKNVCYNKLINQ